MMNIYQKIMFLCPDLSERDFLTVISLQNDGDGDYIAKWEHQTAQKPTDEQLASLT